jgi:hypothetical protein
MGKASAKIKEEAESLIPPTVFFFFALHLVVLVRALMLEGYSVRPGTTTSVTVMSLILGKAVLLADHLPFINRYPTKPLIYNVFWKTIIYALIAVVIHYLEEVIRFWRQTDSLAAANHKLLDEIVWAHFLGIQILLIVMIFSYCTVRELARALGRDRLIEMFLGFHLRGRAAQ